MMESFLEERERSDNAILGRKSRKKVFWVGFSGKSLVRTGEGELRSGVAGMDGNSIIRVIVPSLRLIWRYW